MQVTTSSFVILMFGVAVGCPRWVNIWRGPLSHTHMHTHPQAAGELQN